MQGCRDGRMEDGGMQGWRDGGWRMEDGGMRDAGTEDGGMEGWGMQGWRDGEQEAVGGGCTAGSGPLNSERLPPTCVASLLW